MDPQAAWNQLQESYRAEDWDSVCELAQSLLDWLGRGGFPPVTAGQPTSDPSLQREVVEDFCRSALRQAAK